MVNRIWRAAEGGQAMVAWRRGDASRAECLHWTCTSGPGQVVVRAFQAIGRCRTRGRQRSKPSRDAVHTFSRIERSELHRSFCGFRISGNSSSIFSRLVHRGAGTHLQGDLARPLRGNQTLAVTDEVLELVSKRLDRADHRPCRGIAETAKRTSVNL